MDEKNKLAPEPQQEPKEEPTPAPTPEPTPETPQPSKEEVISKIREEAKASEVKDITTDLDGEKADLIERAEAEPAVDSGIKPIAFGEKMKKKSPVLTIILSVVLVLGLAVAALFIFAPDTINNLFNKTASTPSQTSQTSQTTTEEKEKTSELELTGNSLSDFDLNFLSLETNKNIIYSPLSLKYALSMLKDASAGNSQSQIEAVIGDYQPKAYLNSKNRSLANGMFINEDYSSHIKSSYIDALKSKYNAEVAHDSFSTPAVVNSWISEKTLGIINNMLTENEVNSETKFLLINALAIDMEWERKIQSDSKPYSVDYRHEKYDQTYIPIFDGETTKKATIGADINRYDIINELG
ncbi:MAG: serpin family protein, partial [Candidatus Saccharibacteria bacterium]|nr:serpin family protein [Candidatus Saccharibacteria bacterium]